MSKRKIKSYKGGRNARLDIRLTEEEKQMIQQAADKADINRTDLIVKLCREYLENV